jgi:hypothetical protein
MAVRPGGCPVEDGAPADGVAQAAVNSGPVVAMSIPMNGWMAEICCDTVAMSVATPR